jgi:hypothetical protein
LPFRAHGGLLDRFGDVLRFCHVRSMAMKNIKSTKRYKILPYMANRSKNSFAGRNLMAAITTNASPLCLASIRIVPCCDDASIATPALRTTQAYAKLDILLASLLSQFF